MVDDGGPEKDWPAYVAALDGDALWEAAQAANTAAFVRTLRERGVEGPDVHAILVLFAKRFRALGLEPPQGGYVDLAWLADNS